MSTNYSDAALAVVSNEQNEIFVTGVQATYLSRYLSSAYGSKIGGQGGPLQLFVNRYGERAESSNWSHLIETPCPSDVTCYLRAAGIGLDAQNSSLVLSDFIQEQTDDQNNSTSSAQIYLDKVSPEGQVLWRKELKEAINSRALGLGVAADGSSYVLWQAFAENPFHDPTEDAYLGVKLSKLDPTGTVLWTREIDAPIGYSFDNADVALLDEKVVVADLDSVQAFDLSGELIWQTDIEFAPSNSEEPQEGERFYTALELVASDNQIYLGRNSEQFFAMSEPRAQQLELITLSDTGAVLWEKTLGNEQSNVYDTSLSATSDDNRNNLYVAGMYSTAIEGLPPAPRNFVSVIDAQGNNGGAEEIKPTGTIYGIIGPKGGDVSPYIVGVTGDASFNYDTPDLTAQDAFLSFGGEVKN